MRVIGRKSGGTYIAGEFNQAKVDLGTPAVGNRYVIIRFEDEAAYDKVLDRRRQGWIERNAPGARQLKLERVVAK